MNHSDNKHKYDHICGCSTCINFEIELKKQINKEKENGNSNRN